MTQPHLADSIFGTEGPTGGGAGGRPRPPRRRLQSLLALLISLTVLGGGAYGVYAIARPAIEKLTAGTDYDGPGSGSATVVVSQGDTGGTIAAALVKAGVTKTVEAFVSASADEPDLAKKIQPGKYVLKQEMAAKDALAYLADPANRAVNRVTIPEGLWASEVYERLAKATKTPLKDYLAAVKDGKALGLPAAADGSVEGWLFPDTYEFDDGTSAKAQLRTMVKQAISVMKGEKIPEADWHDTMILASIVESEAGSDADRKKVARVFLNRLDDPTAETVGLLQSDATVSYGIGKRAIAPTPEQKADAGNPFNTHVHKGLPPTPISNPGKSSIDAAAHPAKGPWFYFVTVDPDTGETKFAVTYAEHQKNTEEFLAWCVANKEKC